MGGVEVAERKGRRGEEGRVIWTTAPQLTMRDTRRRAKASSCRERNTAQYGLAVTHPPVVACSNQAQATASRARPETVLATPPQNTGRAGALISRQISLDWWQNRPWKSAYEGRVFCRPMSYRTSPSDASRHNSHKAWRTPPNEAAYLPSP